MNYELWILNYELPFSSYPFAGNPIMNYEFLIMNCLSPSYSSAGSPIMNYEFLIMNCLSPFRSVFYSSTTCDERAFISTVLSPRPLTCSLRVRGSAFTTLSHVLPVFESFTTLVPM